ncbi:MAG: AAA-like domain-containing protein [Candidatus Protochlamydia sp.]|nr:AAA-like domain-containing protein [Candidatus Protochlamydia sp.]
MKTFNTEGPIRPEEHYFIPDRLDPAEVFDLIEFKKYFVLHAPRQSGKTTAIQETVRQLNSNGKYNAVYLNVESAQPARDNVEKALISIIESLKYAIKEYLGDEEKTIAFFDEIVRQEVPLTLNTLKKALTFWAKYSAKPIVLFIDEIDSLMGDSLLSVLKQIRSGYIDRPVSFPQSICLVGLRDVRDYKVWSEESGVYVSTSSPFNIKAKSLLLANFSLENVANLYAQHTKETGQIFEKEAINYAFYLTQGQPWLVNALAYEAAFADMKDRSQPITKEVIEKAKNTLIKRRDTHLDSLVDKLRESRVLPIIDAIINGDSDTVNLSVDDVQYVRDLGLIKLDRMEIANPIYQEIIPRELTALISEGLPERFVLRPGYVRKDGSLDMQKLLEAFKEFYFENSTVWFERFAYKESGPHLLLMAFLQRIINGGGTIFREYALGRGRVDLLIKWQKQRIVLELKVKRRKNTLEEGLAQTAKYMSTSSATEGHLLIFDRDSSDQKFSRHEETCENHLIQVWMI